MHANRVGDQNVCKVVKIKTNMVVSTGFLFCSFQEPYWLTGPFMTRVNGGEHLHPYDC